MIKRLFLAKSLFLTDALHSIAVSVFYWLIAASIAELASSMPSSSGGSFLDMHASKFFFLAS